MAAPGASNVIAGSVNFTVDIRSREDAVRLGESYTAQHAWRLHACLTPRVSTCAGVVEDVIVRIEGLCKQRGLGCAVHRKVRRVPPAALPIPARA